MDEVWAWLAWKLPRGLVYWCGIRMWANATRSKGDASTITADAVLKNWNKGREGK